MSKVKLRLIYGDKNFLIPMPSTKTLRDLATQVEKRFKLKASGFQLDDFHVCLEDEIGDIIENPKEERLVILTEKLDYSKPSPPPTDAGSIPEEKYQDLKQEASTKQQALEAKIKELESENSSLKMRLADMREQVSDAEARAESAEAQAKQASDQAARAEAQAARAEAQAAQAVAAVASPISSGVGSVRSVIRKPSPRSSEVTQSEDIDIPKPKRVPSDSPEVDIDVLLDSPEQAETPQTTRKESPKMTRTPPKAQQPEEEVDQWAVVEQRMKERNRKKKEREMAERTPVAAPAEPEIDPALAEAARASAAENIKKRMSARLAQRKGPRLKLEPTRPRRASAPQKEVKKATLKTKKSSEIYSNDEEEAHSEGEASPRSKIARRMAERMKDRVGPRQTLQPHVKQRDIEAAERRRARSAIVGNAKAKPKAPSSGGGSGAFAGAKMSKKEAARIKRMSLEVGDKLDISGHRCGVLRYMGETEFAPGGLLFGLELIGGALGEHSGTVDGVEYFSCEPRRGVFITSKEIRKKQRKPKPKEPVASVYRRRLERILKEFNPNRLKGLDALLAKNTGNEHLLYLKVCKKYYVSPEKEYFDGTEEC